MKRAPHLTGIFPQLHNAGHRRAMSIVCGMAVSLAACTDEGAEPAEPAEPTSSSGSTSGPGPSSSPMSGGGMNSEPITVMPSMLALMTGETATVVVTGDVTDVFGEALTLQLAWTPTDGLGVVSDAGAASGALEIPRDEPYSESFTITCESDAPPSGSVSFAVRDDAGEFESIVLSVTCESTSADDTMGMDSSFPLVDTGVTFRDATTLTGVTGTASPEGVLVEFDLPADMPADSHEVIWTTVEGTGTSGEYWVGECSDDTARDGRDPQCLIWTEGFMVDVSQPTDTTFGPQSILVPLTEIDGELIYTVDGRAEPVEFFTIYYAVRTPREELERHALDVDVDALLSSLDE